MTLHTSIADTMDEVDETTRKSTTEVPKVSVVRAGECCQVAIQVNERIPVESFVVQIMRLATESQHTHMSSHVGDRLHPLPQQKAQNIAT